MGVDHKERGLENREKARTDIFISQLRMNTTQVCNSLIECSIRLRAVNTSKLWRSLIFISAHEFSKMDHLRGS